MFIRNGARYWDFAATTPSQGKDPDYAVGALLGELDGVYYIIDVRRIRGNPKDVEDLVLQTARVDGSDVEVQMEVEPSSSGKIAFDHYAREILKARARVGLYLS